jgi:hypothetical protein
MDTRTLRWTALAFACLCLAACKEKYDPLKPTVANPVTVASAAAA